MKDINNITDQDKDTLFQVYIEVVDVPETWLKDAKKDFYKSILFRKTELMPYCVVMSLIELGYEL